MAQHEKSTTAQTGGSSPQQAGRTKVRIKLKSFDQKLLDDSIARIKKTAENTGAQIVGPVLLPMKVRKYTILRSVHTDKKSREQFETRTHCRLLDIVEPSAKTIDELMKLVLPPGVEIEIKY